MRKGAPPGIEVRHSTRCGTNYDESCDCTPNYRAIVNTPGSKGKLQKSFKNLQDAIDWRDVTRVDLRRGAIGSPDGPTLTVVARSWSKGVRSGAIRNRSGDVYKPSVVRSYEHALRDYVLPDLGHKRLAMLTRTDVQDFADGLIARGVTPSTLRNALMPLRAICRRSLARGMMPVNPTHGLELPAYRSRRVRIASPHEAMMLMSVVPDDDRPIWAMALYSGLRLGEMQALRWGDLDLEQRLIHVRRGWDPYEGPIAPKSEAGTRTVPLLERLLEELRLVRRSPNPDDLVFGTGTDKPFSGPIVLNRAKKLWTSVGMQSMGLHECRHTYASVMIAAGVNLKALQTFMGHASITITMDRYGHLLPGSENVAAGLANAYLAKALETEREALIA